MSIEKDIKSSKKMPLSRKSIVNVLYTSNWFKEGLQQVLKNFDLTLEQYNVLRILRGQNGNPANLSTIQERMLNKMSNTTRLVDKLNKKGFVTREICKKNRRKIEMYITAKGLEFIAQIDPIINKKDLDMTNKLSNNELQELNYLLEKLRT
ncbi:MarR family transcriptional regulator [Pontimicrobium sp. SW4]|uniref:MarR family transcriptional regulator n=1 Tax=Pontimicrobium sp. SW4 TaxID=3153519 RepID=A0AAU7BUE0_9FLAO